MGKKTFNSMHITAWTVRFARCLTKNFHFNNQRAN